jgi:hypothetical protein
LYRDAWASDCGDWSRSSDGRVLRFVILKITLSCKVIFKKQYGARGVERFFEKIGGNKKQPLKYCR